MNPIGRFTLLPTVLIFYYAAIYIIIRFMDFLALSVIGLLRKKTIVSKRMRDLHLVSESKNIFHGDYSLISVL